MGLVFNLVKSTKPALQLRPKHLCVMGGFREIIKQTGSLGTKLESKIGSETRASEGKRQID
jgi:hypothetical protein